MIKLLSKNVADKIAAGEVVDRPLSIVKELVENAIDAGATNITLEMRNGGKTYIRVTDNGSGINESEVELAFLRHATSKITTDEDLNSILTLGFRGEALSSIAAVSRVELITKTAEAKTGVSLKIHGGEVFEKSATGCPDGTTIIVSDLFYNTPARLKFMKTDATESTLIIDFISKIALAYADIKIRLINNGTILFSTNGKGDTYSNIITVYSKAVGEGLIYISSENENMCLNGYISRPDYSKTNRKQQIFFVNGRVISNKVMDFAVQEGYSERLFEGRYPIAYLFFKIKPELLDVNIHPNKKEVRFHQDMEVKNFIAQSIKRGLLSAQAIPQVNSNHIVKNSAHTGSTGNSSENVILSKPSFPEKINPIVDKFAVMTHNTTEAKNDEVVFKQKIQEAKVNEQVVNVLSENKQEIKKSEVSQEQVDVKNILSTLVKEQEEINYKPDGISKSASSELAPVESFFKKLSITGNIFNTYITATDDNCFYLIDQHAAHERIFYEQLLKQYKCEEKIHQTILTPIMVEVSYSIKSTEGSWVQILRNMGFEIEPFGAKAYIVKEIPMFMDLSEAQNMVNYFLENIAENVDIENEAKVNKIITKACKSAVKANDVLSMAECKRLLEDLAKCQNPYSCPHGRPTFIKMTKYEIEKMFKRV
ncbi:DNA mismatch repair endonuclease MutL [Aminipila sp.]|uniref:DNA mismatch repair endonuclease MutL n=1 Tax=Aminipila sp. TaxID=2060095 RepID=UPI00289C18EA|nr:DNA mismatch repair endonuclease MutL [Aminipila sp.]